MPNLVRFYDAAVVNTALSNYYNDGSVADGSTGKGRFVLTVDPFSAPSGTDGQFDEFDFVVDDPADATMVFWGWVGLNVPAAPTVVTGGFTFDSGAPTTFDYWACFRDTKTDYDTYVAGNLVAGATGYARNNAIFFDGTYTIQGLGFVVGVDGASVADWWTDAPIPVSDTPVITAPVAGTVYTPSDDLTVSIIWTESAETQARVRTVGAYHSDSGILGAVHSFDLFLPYGVSGTVTIEVTAQQTGKSWSAAASENITVTPDLDVPVDCVAAELVADSPLALYLFRDSTYDAVADASGNGNDADWYFGTALAAHEGSDLALSAEQDGRPSTYPGVIALSVETMDRVADTGTGNHGFDFSAANAGDLLLLAGEVHANYSLPPTITIDDAAFTIELDGAIGDVWFFVARKIATGSEATITMHYEGMPRSSMGEIPGSGVFVNAYGAMAIFDSSTYSGYTWALQTETSSVDGPLPGFTTTDPKTRLFFLMMAGSANLTGLYLRPDLALPAADLGVTTSEFGQVSNAADAQEAPFGIGAVVGRWFDESTQADGRFAPWLGTASPWTHLGPRVGLTIVLTPTASYTGTVMTVPKGAIPNGDYLYVAIAATLGSADNRHFATLGSAPSPLSGPSGWTRVAEDTYLGTRWEIWRYDVAASGADPASWDWTGDPSEIIGTWQYWRFYRSVDATAVGLHVGALAGLAGETFPDDPGSLRGVYAYTWVSPGFTGTVGVWSPTADRVSGSESEWQFLPGASAARALSAGTALSGAAIDFLVPIDVLPALRQTPAPICDPACGDTNYFVAPNAAGSELRWPIGIWTADSFTLEYLVRVLADPFGNNGALVRLGNATNEIGDGQVSEFGDPDGKLDVLVSAESGSYAAGQADVTRTGCWLHVIHTYDAGTTTMKVYANGRLVGSTAVAATLTDRSDVYLAAVLGGADIAIAAVYDHALTRKRVATHFRHLCRLCVHGGFVLGHSRFGG